MASNESSDLLGERKNPGVLGLMHPGTVFEYAPGPDPTHNLLVRCLAADGEKIEFGVIGDEDTDDVLLGRKENEVHGRTFEMTVNQISTEPRAWMRRTVGPNTFRA